ncbi:MAG: glycine zipper 2TM domain-containing protein [Alphaproteobacteria bacterium]|nr:glycine zipper 2TM domain-containing protein [Alphaproteobacteria bacterium]
MKTVAITGVAVAALAATAIATPSFARNPCEQQKHNHGTAGAVIGGLAGAALGNSLAHGGGRTGGTIIGGLAGAAIGNNIGRSSTKCDGYAYYNGGYYDRDGHWHGYARTYASPYAGQYGYNSSYRGYDSRPYYDYQDGYASGYYPY